MKIIEVIPLARGIFKNNLSYFTSKEIVPGAIVEIVVRQKKIKALVSAVSELAMAKSRLRTAPFALKKVEQIKNPRLLGREFLQAAEVTANHYGATIAQTLVSVIPQIVIKQAEKLLGPQEQKIKITAVKDKPESWALQQFDDERTIFYRGLVREEFARGQSVLIILPGPRQLLRLEKALRRGIEDYVYVLHRQLKATDFVDAWNRAREMVHPILLMATPSFLLFPRTDFRTIVIENESEESYKKLRRPFIDMRQLAKQLAAALGAKIIFADSLLRLETMWRVETGEYLPAAPIKRRLFPSVASTVLPAVTEPTDRGRAVSDALMSLVERALGRGEKIFAFTARRGLSPIVVCRDCDRLVACKRCLMPVTFHQDKLFVCHHCHEARSAAEYCGYCRGWNLLPLGIGLERVAQELQTTLPKRKLWLVSSDHTPGSKQIAETVTNFYQQGGLLLGTEMAIPWIREKVDYSLVISIDALLSLPEFRISEKVFRLLTKIRLLTEKKFIIQTRNPDWPLFQLAAAGHLREFYLREINDRQQFHYPPFTLLIKISCTGKQSVVLAATRHLEDLFRDYAPEVFEAFTSRRQDRYLAHLLIRLDPKIWPKADLLDKLRSQPPTFRIEVDPRSLL